MAFQAEQTAAIAAIRRLKEERDRAKKLSPSLVVVIDFELKAREAAFEKGVAAAEDFDREDLEHTRAKARANAVRAAVNSSIEIDRKLVETLLRERDVAVQIEGARARRVEAARSVATSQLSRAAHDVGAREKAVNFAEALAGAILARDDRKIPPMPAPDVLAWLRIIFSFEGRAFYEQAAARRKGDPSYDPPKPVDEYDRACSAFWSRVDAELDRAKRHARALGALGPADDAHAAE